MGECELDTFITGFRLGARFIMDTFLSEEAPFESFLERSLLSEIQYIVCVFDFYSYIWYIMCIFKERRYTEWQNPLNPVLTTSVLELMSKLALVVGKWMIRELSTLIPVTDCHLRKSPETVGRKSK